MPEHQAPGDDPLRWRAVLRDHLQQVPAFRALIRTIECRLVAEAGPLAPRLLDVGCGDGLFAAFAFDGQVTAGIDTDASRLAESRSRGRHALCLRARAEHLPFANGSFATVVANCVLEHVEGIDTALDEITRVVSPGGRFVFGVPGPLFGPFLFVSSLLSRVGATRLADAYARWFHGHSRHYHVHAAEVWVRQLESRGFRVERVRPYMSRRAHAIFDLVHYASVPRLIRWRLTGRWVGNPSGPVNRWWERRLAPHVMDDPEEGAYLFFEARRAPDVPAPVAARGAAAWGSVTSSDPPDGGTTV